jgi:hypothetical protein
VRTPARSPLDLVQAEVEVAQPRNRFRHATAKAEDRLRRLIMDPADLSFWGFVSNPSTNRSI